MPFDPTQYLVIGVASRALFDLSAENAIFEGKGRDAYCSYQLHHESDILKPGAAFPLVRAILRLNELVGGKRRAEVVVMSWNSADTSLRIWASIQHYGLDITRAALTGGAPITSYLRPYSVDLFLSANDRDVQAATDASHAAGLIYAAPCDPTAPVDQIRVAFDGDAVLFSEESERIYKEQGLDAFLRHETENARKPLPEGPFAKLLRSLSVIQAELPGEKSPIRTALVTARNGPAHERAIRTLRAWNVRIDEAFFLGGMTKAGVLQAFQPHIFFDDQPAHCEPASLVVPSARVFYPSRSRAAIVREGDRAAS